MATEKEILDEQAFATDRISIQVRTVALSMIAVVWLLLNGDEYIAPTLANKPSVNLLFWCIGFSFVALVADYIQYWAAYKSILETHNKGGDKDGQYKYNTESIYYCMRNWFFRIKQWLLWLAIIALVLAMLGALK